jgi:ABC-2 type transport system ATP-binding protein
MTEPVIETIELYKAYGPSFAVRDLNLTVQRGEAFGFLGPNGAGKSTTVKMLLNLVHPTAGSVQLFGQPATEDAVRSRVGFLPEDFRFHEWLQADEFLRLHGKLYGMTGAEMARRIPMLLEMVGLEGRERQRLSHFSKGMLQRIGLAQAMIHQPELIILDEPTSGLDPLGRRLVRDVITHLQAQGTTIFLNSHLLGEVEITCDRVAFIKGGQVIAIGDTDELLNRTTDVFLRVDSVSDDWRAQMAHMGYVLETHNGGVSLSVRGAEVVPDIIEMACQHGMRIYEVRPQRRTLEDLFVDLMDSTEEATL